MSGKKHHIKGEVKKRPLVFLTNKLVPILILQVKRKIYSAKLTEEMLNPDFSQWERLEASGCKD